LFILKQKNSIKKVNSLESFNYSINKILNTNRTNHISESLSKFAYVKMKTSESSLNNDKGAKFVIFKEKLLELISGKQKKKRE